MYREGFVEAINRTKRKGFGEHYHFLTYDTKPILTNQENKKIIFDKISNIILSSTNKLEELANQCVEIHRQIQIELRETLPTLYTIGWVNMNGKDLYKFEDSDIDSFSMGEHLGLNLHTWLTLPSLEIIDATLLTSHSVNCGINTSIGDILLDNPDNIGGIQYHPMIVGFESLSKMYLNIFN